MAFNQWLTKAGDFVVERVPCDTHLPQTANRAAPPAAVLHTTEGNTIEDAMSVFKQHYAPHFLLGKDVRGKTRILQLVAVGMKGASLEAYNDLSLVQVEMVSFSKTKIWLPDENTLKAIASLMAACEKEYNIPLIHPWKDGDFGAYGVNAHRNSGKFGTVAGWFGHGDIPNNCVVPDTPILCADLSWKQAGDLKKGDAIIGFDENQELTSGIKDNRRLQTSYVEYNRIGSKPCVTVSTTLGDIIASTDHPFLTRIEYKRNASKNTGEWGYRWRWGWKEAKDLEKDDEVGFLCEPWKTQLDYDAGWLSGFFDGEGCLSYKDNHSFQVSASQVIGPTSERLFALLEKFGFTATEVYRNHNRKGHKPAVIAVLRDGRLGAMRFLGSIRPPRLLLNADSIWDNALVCRTIKKARILDVHSAGLRKVANLSTTSRTYVANGFMVHNSHWDPGAIAWTELFKRAAAINHVIPDPVEPPPRPGPTVDLVTPIQESLHNLHFEIDVDGDWGPQTIGVVKSYRILKGLDGGCESVKDFDSIISAALKLDVQRLNETKKLSLAYGAGGGGGSTVTNAPSYKLVKPELSIDTSKTLHDWHFANTPIFCIHCGITFEKAWLTGNVIYCNG